MLFRRISCYHDLAEEERFETYSFSLAYKAEEEILGYRRGWISISQTRYRNPFRISHGGMQMPPLLRLTKKDPYGYFFEQAEEERFELSMPLRACHLSKVVE